MLNCLTDNVNRSVSSIRAALNKTNSKMGVSGSVSYMYDNLCIVSFKGLTEEETIDLMIESDIEIDDIEKDEDNIVIYGNPTSLYEIKEAITNKIPNVTFDASDIVMIPKDKVTLSGEDLKYFHKLSLFITNISI